GNTVNNRLSALWNPVSTNVTQSQQSGFPEPNYLIGEDDKSRNHETTQLPEHARRGKRFWVDGFGSYQEREASSVKSGTISKTGGFVSGFDAAVNANVIAGAFVGGAQSSMAATNGHRAHTETYFGGLYASLGSARGAIDFALTAGKTDQVENRYVASNFAPGGVNIFRLEKDSWFIAPELGLEHRLPVLGLVGSLRGRYTIQFADEYEVETSSVAAREVRFIQGRVELARPILFENQSGEMTRIVPYGGVDYNELLDGNMLDMTINGSDVMLRMDTVEKELTTFAGLRMAVSLSENFTVEAQVEGRVSDEDAKSVAAKIGGSWNF
ncbi:MAG: autotransporter outer membrane beta-barrel domain-containing protein, partial [Methyloligellaceae bacterium]